MLCSFREKFEFIVRATFQHARNLALLTTVYKTLLFVMRKLWGRGHPAHNFVAAFVGGYLVFGENNKVNMQVGVVSLSQSEAHPHTLHTPPLSHPHTHTFTHTHHIHPIITLTSSPPPLTPSHPHTSSIIISSHSYPPLPLHTLTPSHPHRSTSTSYLGLQWAY